MNFRINLTQFYLNFSRKEHQIDVFYVSFNAWDSQVLSYTPFNFSFTVPLRISYTPFNFSFTVPFRISLYESQAFQYLNRGLLKITLTVPLKGVSVQGLIVKYVCVNLFNISKRLIYCNTDMQETKFRANIPLRERVTGPFYSLYLILYTNTKEKSSSAKFEIKGLY